MKKLSFLLFICSIISLYGCKDDNSESQSEIKLSKNELSFEGKGQATNIQLTVTPDTEWSIENTPNWLRIEPLCGTQSTEITLICDPIQDMNGRDTTILVETKDKTIELKIAQKGLSREDLLRWEPLGLPMFGYPEVEYTLAQDGIERTYTFETRTMMITPQIRENTFLGNLINSRFKNNSEITSYSGYTFNPIIALSLSPGSGYKKGTFLPSLLNQQKLATEVIDSKPEQIESFSTDTEGISFYSHRQLHLIGKSNLGIDLEEAISGKSYREKEMSKRYGIAYSYNYALFSLAMNIPYEVPLIKETIKETDYPNQTMSYINEVTYGSIGILIIESDHRLDEIRSIVKQIAQGKELSAKDNNILDDIEAYHIFFDRSAKMHVEKGKADVIKAYHTRLSNNLHEVYPISFNLANYFTHGVETASFSFILP